MPIITSKAAGGGSSPSIVTVALSSTDILALHSSPKSLVAAPGAGKLLVPLTMWATYTHVTTDYTMNDSYGFAYTGVPGGIYVQGAPAAIDGTQNNGGVFSAFAGATYNAVNGISLSSFVNKGLVFTGDSDPTGGDGTVSVTVVYITVTP